MYCALGTVWDLFIKLYEHWENKKKKSNVDFIKIKNICISKAII